jgi:hypothetical protein
MEKIKRLISFFVVIISVINIPHISIAREGDLLINDEFDTKNKGVIKPNNVLKQENKQEKSVNINKDNNNDKNQRVEVYIFGIKINRGE